MGSRKDMPTANQSATTFILPIQFMHVGNGPRELAYGGIITTNYFEFSFA
jgi:hypothetical protein